MLSYLIRHVQVLFATLGDMCRTPASSINTLIVVAITLLLPCLLYIGVKTAEQLNNNWQGRPQVSIFLDKTLGKQEAQLIFDEIRLHPAIELAEFISPEQALQEFRILSSSADSETSLSDELAFLGENPLPPSIVVMPPKDSSESASLLALKEQLNKIEGIDIIRLDLDWTDRFAAILKVFTRVAGLLSILLAVGLILIVSNTIKLLILNRQQEIVITKLVGGTDAFVRRPFLYYGALFGLFGAAIALGLLLLAAFLIAEPLSELASLYETNSIIYQFSPMEMLATLFIGSFLGWMASRWSVAQHLRQIQPR
ncbi:MAG: cell division transport system permease protein [Cryomorphaceae bacterium]|jgi:cell division transport system permease protein